MILKTSMEENNKTLLTDIQEELNKWKDITYSGTRSLNIIKISTSSKSFYSFIIITNKMSLLKNFGSQTDFEMLWKIKIEGLGLLSWCSG